MTLLETLERMKQDGKTNEQILDYVGECVVIAGIATSDSMWMRSISGERRGIVLIERGKRRR